MELMDVFNSSSDDALWEPADDNSSSASVHKDPNALYNDSVVMPVWSVGFRGRNLVMGVVGTVLNCLTLLAVIRSEELTRSLRAALVSLVSTDLGLTLTTLTASLLYTPSDLVVSALVYLFYIFVDCTALTLMVIAADRAVAVHFPAWYKANCERWLKIITGVLLPWLLAICLTVVSLQTAITHGVPRLPISLLTDIGVLLQGILLLTSGVGVLVFYVAMACRFKRRSDPLAVHPTCGTRVSTTVSNVTPAVGQRARRATVHTSFLAAWFCIIYIPFSCYFLMLYFTGSDRSAEINSMRNMVMSSFIVINSIINPLIFFWRLVCLRRAMAFCRKLLSRRSGDVTPGRDQHSQSDGYVLSPVAVRRSVRVHRITVESNEEQFGDSSSDPTAHSGHVEIEMSQVSCTFHTTDMYGPQRHVGLATVSGCTPVDT